MMCIQSGHWYHEDNHCLQALAGLPQSRQGLQSPAEGGQAGGEPQLKSQDRLVFAQPMEELDPSDTEQEKVQSIFHVA